MNHFIQLENIAIIFDPKTLWNVRNLQFAKRTEIRNALSERMNTAFELF
jgi:hypothetical protein